MIVDIGPSTVFIKARNKGRELSLDRSFLEGELKAILGELREVLPVLKRKASMVKNMRALPEVARRMVEAAKAVDGLSLTPMAAVAGAVADLLLERILCEYELDFLFVNNGGDISVYSKDGAGFRIALAEIHAGALRQVFWVSGLERVGVATSGLGGRSFTLGICDSVTVFAESGALSDAAATFICNASFLGPGCAETAKAKELDPLSDLEEEEVVLSRRRLKEEEIREALKRGKEAALSLKGRGVILEAFLCLEDLCDSTIEDGSKIRLEVRYGG